MTTKAAVKKGQPVKAVAVKVPEKVKSQPKPAEKKEAVKAAVAAPPKEVKKAEPVKQAAENKERLVKQKKQADTGSGKELPRKGRVFGIHN